MTVDDQAIEERCIDCNAVRGEVYWPDDERGRHEHRWYLAKLIDEGSDGPPCSCDCGCPFHDDQDERLCWCIKYDCRCVRDR